MQTTVAHAGFDWRRRRLAVDTLVVHESVTHSVEATIAVLKRRNLGVHLVITPGGEVLELAPSDHVVFHAGELNGRSVGIEVVSPYYPGADGHAPAPWQRVIEARWAHKGRYVVPLPVQLEALWDLLQHLAVALPLPLTWPGLVSRQRFALSVVAGAEDATGVQAHIYTAHADGGVPVLYSWLRSRGLEATEAYETVVRLATGARAWADVSAYTTSPATPATSRRSS